MVLAIEFKQKGKKEANSSCNLCDKKANDPFKYIGFAGGYFSFHFLFNNGYFLFNNGYFRIYFIKPTGVLFFKFKKLLFSDEVREVIITAKSYRCDNFFGDITCKTSRLESLYGRMSVKIREVLHKLKANNSTTNIYQFRHCKTITCYSLGAIL
jgi:hypothetical protein